MTVSLLSKVNTHGLFLEEYFAFGLRAFLSFELHVDFSSVIPAPSALLHHLHIRVPICSQIIVLRRSTSATFSLSLSTDNV